MCLRDSIALLGANRCPECGPVSAELVLSCQNFFSAPWCGCEFTQVDGSEQPQYLCESPKGQMSFLFVCLALLNHVSPPVVLPPSRRHASPPPLWSPLLCCGSRDTLPPRGPQQGAHELAVVLNAMAGHSDPLILLGCHFYRESMWVRCYSHVRP